MTDLRMRARTVSELVDAAFALYRQHPLQYIVVTALAYAPLLLVQLLVPDVARPAPGATFSSVQAAVTLLALVTYALMAAVVVKLGSQAYLGADPDVATTVRQVLPRLPAIIVAGILVVPLYVIGFLCLFVGAFYVLARWFAVSAAIVLEGKGPVEAFGRSSELTRGRKRHVLNTLLLVFLIYGILSIGVGALAGLFGSLVLRLVISTAFTIVAHPVIGLTEMLLYYDMRIRGEGFDLEQMAGALDAQAVPLR